MKAFYTPIETSSIPDSDITTEIDEIISNIDDELGIHNLGNVWGDQINSTYGIKDSFDSHHLHKRVLSKAKWFYFDHTGNDSDLIITSSFINFYSKGHYQSFHQHYDDMISAVYFHKCPPGSSSLIFKNPNPVVDYYRFTMQDRFWEIPPIENQLVLFPSWLSHKVEINQSVKPRITIAYNFKLK